MNPEISAARDDLRATLGRLGKSLDKLTMHAARGELLGDGYSTPITFRPGREIEARLNRFMAARGIVNQAAAIRLLLATALTEEGPPSCNP